MAEHQERKLSTLELLPKEQHPAETFSLPSLQVFQLFCFTNYQNFKLNMPYEICHRHMLFAVHPDPCYILTATVIEGHKISKGWVRDFVDTPDPYIILRVPGSPNGRKKTKHFDNTVSPTWEETFTFVIDLNKNNELEVTLMDANYMIDQKMGCEKIDLSSLILDEEQKFNLQFGVASEVIIGLCLSVCHNSDLRYSLALCDKEKEFKRRRRKVVMSKLCELLGEQSPQKESEVPTLSIIGSGGGFRAMTAFSGAFCALSESGILDCATYAAGLSGSAWYLSTLYSHPDFPCKLPGELQEELKMSIRHSPFWLLSPRSLYRYITSIKEKRKSGQPVSFTDFFGHLLGDTLLKERTSSKLSDQQQVIDSGQVPMPLYTCLHVKSNVSAKVFQDWLEFSPYEIGIAKYATFMKTEDFGSKLFKGKVIKKYSEYPLHYLQGIWGSAFCILFKRLIQERTKLSLDLSAHNEDCNSDEDEVYFDAAEEFQDDEEEHIRNLFENLDLDECDDEGKDDSDHSESDDEQKDYGDGSPRRKIWLNIKSYFGVKKSSQQLYVLTSPPTKNVSTDICNLSQSPTGLRKMLSSTFWKDFINNVCTSSMMNTRKGRAGLILNPLRGLSLIPCFPFSPFSPTSPSDDMLFKGLTEPVPTHSKTLYLVDGGLTFNLPFPLLLRPQRAVDMYLTFDFSSRDSDNSAPFKELLLSEKWANINNCLFPPIRDLVVEYMKEPLKECYVFKHPTNELCPVILHFPLVNCDFKEYLAPGVKRETQEDKDFADFCIFSDPKKPYSIYNFKYPHRQFERLSKLMEFNVLNNIHIIKETMAAVIERKKRVLSQAELVLGEPPMKKLDEA